MIKIKMTLWALLMWIQGAFVFSDTAQPLTVTTDNFLLGLSQTAESSPVSLSFVYSNQGVLTSRSLFVVVPQGFTSSNNAVTYPVCFAFHGTAKDGISAAKKGAQTALNSGCVMISPVGGKTKDGMYSWNANGTTTEDDLAFVTAIWNVIKADSRVSDSRVYAYGHSVGSLFVTNVLATQTDIFAGLMGYSSQLVKSTTLTTAPIPVNMVYFNGADDTMIPANGGPAKFDSTLVFYSVSESVKQWAKHNGCSGNITTETNNTLTRYYAADCNGSMVDAYVLRGVGHGTVQPVEKYFSKSAAALLLYFFESKS